MDLNEINTAKRDHMYLDSCKAASQSIEMAQSYATNKVRRMKADLIFSRNAIILQQPCSTSHPSSKLVDSLLLVAHYVWAHDLELMISHDSSGGFK